MACAPALCALAPLGWSLVGAGLAAASDPGLLLPGGTLAAMGWSLAWAAAWAGCALVAAVPAAWWLAWQAPRRAAWVACLIAGPALVPGYVVLAGLRVGRAPGWWLGDALEGGPGWLSVWADRALAGLAQAVWLWPVMTLLLWPVLAGVTGEAVDAARSLGAGPARIMRLALGQARRGVAAVWLAGALVGLGSAVPAHLSGAPTLAARLWSELALRPSAEVWAGAWPVLLVAVAGAAWAAGLVWTSDGRGWQAGAPPRQWRAPGARSAALLGLGLPAAVWVGVLALMAVGVGRWAWLAGFVREHGGAAGQSGALALGVGVVSFGAGLGAWRACSGFGGAGGAGARWVVAASVAGFLVPGVLIGSAVRQSAEALVAPWLSDAALRWMDRSGALLVVANSARFGWLGVLAGVMAARQEPVALAQARAVLAGSGWAGWWRAALGSGAGPACTVAAGAVAAACLALHEIETSVALAPPGARSLPLVVLEALHYNHDRRASAAGLLLAGLGLALSGAGAAAVACGGWGAGVRGGGALLGRGRSAR